MAKKKKANEPAEKTVIAPVIKPMEAPAKKTAQLVSCAACHATIERSEIYKCRVCGTYGCGQCAFGPTVIACPRCDYKVRRS